MERSGRATVEYVHHTNKRVEWEKCDIIFMNFVEWFIGSKANHEQVIVCAIYCTCNFPAIRRHFASQGVFTCENSHRCELHNSMTL